MTNSRAKRFTSFIAICTCFCSFCSCQNKSKSKPVDEKTQVEIPAPTFQPIHSRKGILEDGVEISSTTAASLIYQCLELVKGVKDLNDSPGVWISEATFLQSWGPAGLPRVLIQAGLYDEAETLLASDAINTREKQFFRASAVEQLAENKKWDLVLRFAGSTPSERMFRWVTEARLASGESPRKVADYLLEQMRLNPLYADHKAKGGVKADRLCYVANDLCGWGFQDVGIFLLPEISTTTPRYLVHKVKGIRWRGQFKSFMAKNDVNRVVKLLNSLQDPMETNLDHRWAVDNLCDFALHGSMTDRERSTLLAKSLDVANAMSVFRSTRNWKLDRLGAFESIMATRTDLGLKGGEALSVLYKEYTSLRDDYLAKTKDIDMSDEFLARSKMTPELWDLQMDLIYTSRSLVAGLAGEGRIEESLKVCEILDKGYTDYYHHIEAIVKVAIRQKHFDTAVKVSLLIQNNSSQGHLLGTVIDALLKDNQYKQAVEVCRQIPRLEQSLWEWGKIITQMQQGNLDATKVFDEMMELYRRKEVPVNFIPWRPLIQSACELGRWEQARSILSDFGIENVVLETANYLPFAPKETQVEIKQFMRDMKGPMTDIVLAQINAQFFSDALQTIKTINDNDTREIMNQALALGFTRADQPAEGIAVAERIDNPALKVGALLKIYECLLDKEKCQKTPICLNIGIDPTRPMKIRMEKGKTPSSR